jgi:hypothetical protein
MTATVEALSPRSGQERGHEWCIAACLALVASKRIPGVFPENNADFRRFFFKSAA